MITVLTTFYHPRLGAVRGAVVDGVPMLSCRETAALLGCHDYEETERAMRRSYVTREVTVPVGVDAHGIAQTEKLLFIDAVAVLRLIECSANRAWERYAAWFNDYVFPSLRQLNITLHVSRGAHRFYESCTDPLPPRSAHHDTNDFFSLFE